MTQNSMCGHIYSCSAKLYRRIQSKEIMRLGVLHKGEIFHESQANLGAKWLVCEELSYIDHNTVDNELFLLRNFTKKNYIVKS